MVKNCLKGQCCQIFDSHSHSHCLLMLDPGSAYFDDFGGGGFVHSEIVMKCRSRIKDQEAMAVAVAVKKFHKN